MAVLKYYLSQNSSQKDMKNFNQFIYGNYFKTLDLFHPINVCSLVNTIGRAVVRARKRARNEDLNEHKIVSGVGGGHLEGI